MGKGISKHLRRAVPMVALLACMAVAGGCARSAAYREPDLFRSAIFAPLPPSFVAGPVAVALTNSGGFSARVQAEGAVPGNPVPLHGQLFGRGPRLLFAPDPGGSEDEGKKRREVDPGFSFLWNVAENRGWLLSEALQAYAPVSAGIRYASVSVTATTAPPRQLTATLISGGTYEARIWPGPGDFPARITAGTNETAMTVTLTRVRTEAPPAELFVIPQGFTPYSSPEALVDELAARQRGFHRKQEPEPVPLMPQ